MCRLSKGRPFNHRGGLSSASPASILYRKVPGILAALLVLAGTAAAAPERVLHRPSENSHDILDPQLTISSEAVSIDRDLFTGLMALDNHRHLIPGVAQGWDISIDGLVWTFHLRPGLKWSNGDPLTAADFVYSFRRLVDPKTGAYNPSDLDQVSNALAIRSGKESDTSRLGVVAVDPVTLRITLVEPRAAFRNLLADPQLMPLHRATVERWGDAWTRPEHIVSNGPYVMKSWVPKGEVTLLRNPNFYDASTVRIGEVEWHEAVDHAASIDLFRKGALDFVEIGNDDLTWARQTVPDQLHSALADEVYFLFFNMVKGPLAKDVRLREAINLAIDRDLLVSSVDPHGERPAYSLVSPLVTNYSAPEMPFKATPMPSRLEHAAALVRDAGYTPAAPLKLTLIHASGEATTRVLAAIADMLRPLGIDLSIERVEWQELGERERSRSFDLGWLSELAEYDDYELMLQDFWTGSNAYNFSGYANPKYDALFRNVMTEMDPAKRSAEAAAAERLVLADFPLAPIYFNARNRVVSPSLQNFPDEIHYPQSRYLAFKDPPK